MSTINRAVNWVERARADADNAPVTTASRLGDWLGLAATPTFATMAMLISLEGHSTSMLGSIGSGMLLGGMLPMYLLMTVFHSPPWLKLVFGRGLVRRVPR